MASGIRTDATSPVIGMLTPMPGLGVLSELNADRRPSAPAISTISVLLFEAPVLRRDSTFRSRSPQFQLAVLVSTDQQSSVR